MIHYTIWFNLKAGADEQAMLTRTARFLETLRSQRLVDSFRVLRNRAAPGRTKMPRFQATISFVDAEQFARPFARVAEAGVHTGEHGRMIEDVDDFQVEIFEDVEVEADKIVGS